MNVVMRACIFIRTATMIIIMTNNGKRMIMVMTTTIMMMHMRMSVFLKMEHLNFT